MHRFNAMGSSLYFYENLYIYATSTMYRTSINPNYTKVKILKDHYWV